MLNVCDYSVLIDRISCDDFLWGVTTDEFPIFKRAEFPFPMIYYLSLKESARLRSFNIYWFKPTESVLSIKSLGK